MLHHRLVPLVLPVALLVPPVLSGCGNKEDASADVKPPVVRVGTPLVKDVSNYEYFQGRIDAVESVEVRARVTGYLVKVDFTAGADVKKNKVLFQIDPREYKAKFDTTVGQLDVAEAELKLATANYARAREQMRTPGAISPQEVDRFAAAQAKAQAEIKTAQANRDSAKLDLDFTDVLCPIDGVVGRNLITVGNLVTKDSTLLTTVVSEDQMYAYFDVPERVFLNVQKLIREGKIKGGKDGKVKVEYRLANEGDEYPHTDGEMDFVNNQFDTSTGTLQVRGILPNPEPKNGGNRLLTPGLFVYVRIPLGEPRKSLIVPQSAIGTDQSKKFLYVVNDEKVVEHRPVTLGAEQPGGLQVVEPVDIIKTKDGVREAQPGEKGEPSIKKGDQIVLTGLQRVRPGIKVDPREPGKD
jgi:multidrug efflux system membrane fusion protein